MQTKQAINKIIDELEQYYAITPNGLVSTYIKNHIKWIKEQFADILKNDLMEVDGILYEIIDELDNVKLLYDDHAGLYAFYEGDNLSFFTGKDMVVIKQIMDSFK